VPSCTGADASRSGEVVMLTHLQIRDFALVEKLELELGQGMTVLTGETGAGKSILLDALGLTLGNRADTGLIRHGASRAEITVEFELADRPEVWGWLEEHDLDDETACHIRRTIAVDGRSRSYINGRSAPLQLLRELGEMLVDIHGQHEHQSLLRRDMQCQLLDGYAGHGKLLTGLTALYRDWREFQDKLEQLRQAEQDRDARLGLLSYQVHELDALGLSVDELPELEREHQRLANASQLLDECQLALDLLYENEELSASSLLDQAVQHLQSLQMVDNTLQGVVELLSSAVIQIEEAAGELRHYLSDVELNPQRLRWVEERLSTTYELARKHHVEAGQLAALLPGLQQQLLELEQVEIHLAELRQSIDAAHADYLQSAKKLSANRRKAAKQLGKAVTENMQLLGMEGGCFEIRLIPLESEEPSELGQERIEFLVSANPGQPLKPLAKVASGGELARISLAIQVIAAQNASIPTLIFDEVDVGIGGGVAEIVGRQLRALGKYCQVLCVTHQPQVAALALHHLQVSKQTRDGKTLTMIQLLDSEQRVHELARMAGGIEMTDQTLSHAREMIERGQALQGSFSIT